MSKTFLFQAIQFSQTVLIQFSIRTQFSFIKPIDRALSSANTPGQSGPGSDSGEEVLCIFQSSIVTEILPSDCLVSYPGHLSVVVGSYPSAEVQSVYSTAAAKWAIYIYIYDKFFLLVNYIKSSLLNRIWRYHSSRSFYVSFSRTDSGLCI